MFRMEATLEYTRPYLRKTKTACPETYERFLRTTEGLTVERLYRCSIEMRLKMLSPVVPLTQCGPRRGP